ncbi:MAG: hypothetical protein MK060_15375 [Blastomonas sp.]|uniref:hypothetical protein n=1 Tax=Blastomonas sp. TaxID=1909299 RepID=UPI00406A13C9|nr:hypothetical protein [Blastomonas sp.]
MVDCKAAAVFCLFEREERVRVIGMLTIECLDFGAIAAVDGREPGMEGSVERCRGVG